MYSVYAYTNTPSGPDEETLVCEEREKCLSVSLATSRGEASCGLVGFDFRGSAGEDCRIYLFRHGGRGTEYTADCTAVLRPGDGFLLCSRGFFTYVTQTEMEIDFIKAAAAEAWATLLLLRLAPRCRMAQDFSLVACMIPAEDGRQK